MKFSKTKFPLLLMALLLASVFSKAEGNALPESKKAVYGLIQRTLPGAANRFEVEFISKIRIIRMFLRLSR